jgi:hypothetical protein
MDAPSAAHTCRGKLLANFLQKGVQLEIGLRAHNRRILLALMAQSLLAKRQQLR